LAEIIALLGPPPPGLVARGLLRSKFFSEQGQSPYLLLHFGPDVYFSSGEFQAGIEGPPAVSLDQLETNLEGSDRKLFLQFMSKMLQWDPQNRQTAKQLLEDQWLKKHTYDV
jgi:serine/threonine protein kinase